MLNTIHTKEGRNQARQYQFNKLIEAGYIQEKYKGLDFFSLNDGKFFTLKVYRGNSSNHVEYVNYRTQVRRAEVIQSYKNNYDRNEQYKAEKKENNKGKSSNHAGAAAAIKSELKAAFPGIKFSVTSDSFSMGDSVHISWEDGPTRDEVKNISCKYQYGSFNGMEDIYEYTNSREDIPQSKYVSENRSQSETVKNLLPQFEQMLTGYEATDWHDKPDQIFYRVFHKTSFPANYTNLQILKTDCMAGSSEDFYQLSFTAPTQPQQPETPQIKEVEVKAGEIQIIEYGKGIVVIGDTKPIRHKLGKEGLRGIYQPRLSCGPGWIFPKSRLEEVTKALTEEPDTLETEIQKTVEFFEETDRKIYGEVQEDTKVIKMLQSPVKQYETIEDITEAANNGEVISLLNICEIVNHV
jgi:hypothetical protein